MKNIDRASRRIPPTISCTSILFHNLILFVFRMISCETWAVHLVEIDRASRRNRPFISCISIPLSEAAPCLFPSYPASNIAPPERGPGIPVSLGVDSAVVANLCKSDKIAKFAVPCLRITFSLELLSLASTVCKTAQS